MESTAIVYINGMIDADTFKDIQLALTKYPAYTCIELRIDSFGGYVYQAKQVYTFLRKEALRGVKIKTVGYAMIYSAATVIFMAGDERVLFPNSEFLIHLPMSGNLDGMNIYELRDYANDLEKDQNTFVTLYSQLTGIAFDVVLEYMKENKAWNAQRTLQEGFATSIDNTVNVFANVDVKREAVCIWDKPLAKEKVYKYEKYMDSGLGIPRESMPQIESFIFEMFIAYFCAKYGQSAVSYGTCPANELKPTQLEISAEVLLNKAVKKEYKDRVFLISREGNLLDGHHDWAAALEENEYEPLNFAKIDLPIKQLLKEANNLKITYNEPTKMVGNIEELYFIYDYEHTKNTQADVLQKPA
jgi:ATP-dependent protease ClpP protease subunit